MLAVPSAQAQNAELARLVGLYRGGGADAAVTGLMALSRTAETYQERALIEYHLGLALLRVRGGDATSALRRSIALNPDLRPGPDATAAEQRAWSDAWSRMRVPRSVEFVPSSTIVGAGDSIGITVEVPPADGQGQPRVRVLLAGRQGGDPVAVWTGIAGDRGMWDGFLNGEAPQDGVFPLIVEVFSDSSEAPLRWRRSVQIKSEPVSQTMAMPPRPMLGNASIAVRVADREKRERARRSAIRWMTAGTVSSFIAWRTVPDAIRISPPNGVPRIAVATVYTGGIGAAAFGLTRYIASYTRRYESVVLVPDEPLLRAHRTQLAAWQADSARVTAFNGRRESLRRVTLQVQERR